MRQADVDFVVRTDLAIEERERVWESGSEIAGVRMREWEAADAGIRVTEVLVCDERGEEALGKPVGVYLTLDAPSLAKKDEDYHREVSEELSGLLRGMFVDHGLEAERMERPVRTLVVGLGNPEATPMRWDRRCWSISRRRGIWRWSTGRIFAGSMDIRS